MQLPLTSMIKRIAGFFLSVAFFLPLAQCTAKMGDKAGPDVITAYSAYPWPSIGSAIACVVFFWPLVAQTIILLRPQPLGGLRWSIAEIALCIFSASGIAWLVLGGRIRYGAFVAYGAVIAYGSASIVELVGHARKRRGVDSGKNLRRQAGLSKS